jgi:hypothetical protein
VRWGKGASYFVSIFEHFLSVQANSPQRLTLSNAASRRAAFVPQRFSGRSGNPDRVYFSLSAIIPSMSRMLPSRMISFMPSGPANWRHQGR